MILNKWQKRWIKRAEETAKWSKDQNTKIGVVIVNDKWKSQITEGYNGIARGVNDCEITYPERYSRENGEKYYWNGHGERNAIDNCARDGKSTLEKTMYMNCGIPCTGCAISIINSGIKKVFCRSQEESSTKDSDKWNEEAKRSFIMFGEAGIELIQYKLEDL